jgi:hypothetical protein
MKIKVPIEVDVQLNRTELMSFLKEWIYPILKKYKLKGSDWCNSKAIVKDNKLYWQYQETIGQNGDTFLTEIKYEPINISDEKVFNLCKAGVELLEAYSEIHAKSKYAYINGVI